MKTPVASLNTGCAQILYTQSTFQTHPPAHTLRPESLKQPQAPISKELGLNSLAAKYKAPHLTLTNIFNKNCRTYQHRQQTGGDPAWAVAVRMLGAQHSNNILRVPNQATVVELYYRRQLPPSSYHKNTSYTQGNVGKSQLNHLYWFCAAKFW